MNINEKVYVDHTYTDITETFSSEMMDALIFKLETLLKDRHYRAIGEPK